MSAAHSLSARGLDGPLARGLLGLAMVLGMAWAVLPSGLEFDAAVRDAIAVSGGGHGLFALQWMPLILLSLGVIALRFFWFSLMVRHLNPWFIALLVWGFASMAWAPDAFTVFKQVVGLSGVTLLAVAFGLAAWSPPRFTSVFMPVTVVFLLLSLVVGLAVPEVGIHSERQFELNGSWRGITYQKNGLGQLGVFGAILCFHAWCARQGRPSAMLAGTALALLMILLSRSSTSLLLAFITCGSLYLRLRAPVALGPYRTAAKTAAWLAILAPLFCYMVVIGSFDSRGLAQGFGEIFGKDATFSGRTYIWAELLRSIGEHPWIGVGFNSFWPTHLSADTIARLGWPCPSGHNGYLDVMNELGLIGFGLLIMLIVRHFADCARLSRVDPAQAALHGAIMLYVVLANLTESGWFVALSFTHIIVGYSSVMVSRLLFEARLQALQQASARPTAEWQIQAHPSPVSLQGSAR